MRVYLDAVRLDDLDRFAAWYADPGLAALVVQGIATPLGPEDERAWFEAVQAAKRDRRAFTFAIRRLQDGAAVGTVGVTIGPGLHCGTLGIAIGDPGARGQGLGGEAMELMMRFVFDEIGLHRLELRVFDFNEPARRLYARLGFREEGRLRDTLFRDGRFHDEIVMAMLAPEYRARTEAVTPPGWIRPVGTA